jgi:hypothetical protein
MQLSFVTVRVYNALSHFLPWREASFSSSTNTSDMRIA